MTQMPTQNHRGRIITTSTTVSNNNHYTFPSTNMDDTNMKKDYNKNTGRGVQVSDKSTVVTTPTVGSNSFNSMSRNSSSAFSFYGSKNVFDHQRQYFSATKATHVTSSRNSNRSKNVQNEQLRFTPPAKTNNNIIISNNNSNIRRNLQRIVDDDNPKPTTAMTPATGNTKQKQFSSISVAKFHAEALKKANLQHPTEATAIATAAAATAATAMTTTTITHTMKQRKKEHLEDEEIDIDDLSMEHRKSDIPAVISTAPMRRTKVMPSPTSTLQQGTWNSQPAMHDPIGNSIITTTTATTTTTTPSSPPSPPQPAITTSTTTTTVKNNRDDPNKQMMKIKDARLVIDYTPEVPATTAIKQDNEFDVINFDKNDNDSGICAKQNKTNATTMTNDTHNEQQHQHQPQQQQQQDTQHFALFYQLFASCSSAAHCNTNDTSIPLKEESIKENPQQQEQTNLPAVTAVSASSSSSTSPSLYSAPVNVSMETTNNATGPSTPSPTIAPKENPSNDATDNKNNFVRTISEKFEIYMEKARSFQMIKDHRWRNNSSPQSSVSCSLQSSNTSPSSSSNNNDENGDDNDSNRKMSRRRPTPIKRRQRKKKQQNQSTGSPKKGLSRLEILSSRNSSYTKDIRRVV